MEVDPVGGGHALCGIGILPMGWRRNAGRMPAPLGFVAALPDKWRVEIVNRSPEWREVMAGLG